MLFRSIYEYDNTNGCFVPETPTKLGIWPKFEPRKYLDTTLNTPVEMIQGHDGSLVLSYGDYRDDLILELEKRIYNNIKINYDTKKCYFPNCQIQYFIKQKNCSIDGPSLNFLGLRKHDDCQCYEYVPMFNIINR